MKAYPLHVSGASHEQTINCNGPYEVEGEHNGRPVYRNVSGDVHHRTGKPAVIYFSIHHGWLIFAEGRTFQWDFRCGGDAELPPASGWHNVINDDGSEIQITISGQ